MRPFTEMLRRSNQQQVEQSNNPVSSSYNNSSQTPDEILKAIESFFKQHAPSNRPEVTSTNGSV